MHRVRHTAWLCRIMFALGDNVIIEEIRKNVNRTPDSEARGHVGLQYILDIEKKE